MEACGGFVDPFGTPRFQNSNDVGQSVTRTKAEQEMNMIFKASDAMWQDLLFAKDHSQLCVHSLSHCPFEKPPSSLDTEDQMGVQLVVGCHEMPLQYADEDSS